MTDEKKPDLAHLANVVPILGRTSDDATINLLRKVLALAEKGEVHSVALVAEKSNPARDVIIAHAFGLSDKLRLVGAAAIGLRRMQDEIVGAPKNRETL